VFKGCYSVIVINSNIDNHRGWFRTRRDSWNPRCMPRWRLAS